MKPPFRIWRIWHRAKIAKRQGDVEMLNKLAIEYSKLVKREARLAEARRMG